MGNGILSTTRTVSNPAVIAYLSSWPGSILDWSDQDLSDFASCFSVHHVAAGKEISTKDPRSFFIVAEGAVEVQAILPTMRKKTGNIREFLCPKKKGDMVFIPSMRKLISVSQAKEFFERETCQHADHRGHKSVLERIDTVSIKSISESTILQLDWKRFNQKFTECATASGTNHKRKVDVRILRVMMETNLTDYLEKLPILSGIPNSKLETLVRMCRYKVQQSGDVICREGDVGDEVFILLSGEVKVEALASKRLVDLMERNKAECSVSEGGSEDDEKPSLKLLILKQGKKIFNEIATDGPRDVLNSTAANAEQDDDGPPSLDCDHCIELARLGPSDYFGEMATFIDLPRAATVTAISSKVLMACLSKTDFRILYHAISPHLESNIEQVVKDHMIQNIFKLKSPFLQQIDEEQMNKMAEKASIQKMDKGEVVFREGEIADKFYLVYHGSLAVQASEEINGEVETVGHITSGDYFGELAVINKSRRLATITAVSNVVLLAIEVEDFHGCFEDSPELVAEVIARMQGRNCDLCAILGHHVSRSLLGDYAKEHHSFENFDFYEEVLAFTGAFDGMTKEEVEMETRRILDKFLRADSPHAINVPHTVYQKTQEMVTSQQFSRDIFQDAHKEIGKILETDLLPRFKKSDGFLEFLSKIRFYDPLLL